MYNLMNVTAFDFFFKCLSISFLFVWPFFFIFLILILLVEGLDIKVSVENERILAFFIGLFYGAILYLNGFRIYMFVLS